MAGPPNRVELNTLSQRARDLYVARDVRRYLQWYRKAARRAPMAELFEQLVLELEAPEVRQPNLDRLRGQFEALIERLDGGPPRFAAVHASGICLALPESRVGEAFFSFSRHDLWWMEPKQVKADERLWDEAKRSDFRALAAMSQADLERLDTSALGPLWPGSEPHWLAARWPTPREARRRTAREWGDDRPEFEPKGAPLRRPSRRVPEAILQALDGGPFEMLFSIEGEHVTPRTVSKGAHAVSYIALNRGAVGVTMRASHRFRRPARREDLARLARHAKELDRLRPLLALYREHDGGLLFCLEGGPRLAFVHLVGLCEQRAAKRLLFYDTQSEDIDDEERVPAVLARLGVGADSLHVLAFVGSFTLVVPLDGPLAGRVIRITPTGACKEFAADAVSGLSRLVGRVVSLASDQHLLEPGVETGHQVRSTVLRLRRVREAAR